MRRAASHLLRLSGFAAVCAVGGASGACSKGADPAGARASAAAPAEPRVVVFETMGQARSSSVESSRPPASDGTKIGPSRGLTAPPLAKMDTPRREGRPRAGTLPRVLVLASRTAVLTKAAAVQVDLDGEAYEPPAPLEPPSIATIWATAPPAAPRSPECDGCMRLTTTPRGPRPPVHAYVFTEVAGADDSAIRGGYGGHVVGERVLLGGGGFGLARHVPLRPATGTKAGAQRDSLGAGGFFGALLPFPHWDVQPIAGAFVGLGNLTYKLDSTQPYPGTPVFVIAPQLTLEAQTSNLTRFGIGASYRAIEGSDLANRLTEDVSGPTGFAFVLFGYR